MEAITIVQGETIVFTLKLRKANGDPYDLTNFDKYKVCFKGADGSVVSVDQAGVDSKVEVLSSPLLGLLQVTLDKTFTATLYPDDRQHIHLEIDNAATPAPKRAVYEGVLTVKEFLCPN